MINPKKNWGVFSNCDLPPSDKSIITDFCADRGISLQWIDKDIRPDLDLVVVLGGDGAVLRLANLDPPCPILAINYGTVGFLSAGDRAALKPLLERAWSGDYVISQRIRLQCSSNTEQLYALNEVGLSIARGLIEIECFINNAHVRCFRGDGILVGTPTGSTAYLMSTGGPVVMPGVEALIINGINECSFSSRPLVVEAGAKIRLEVKQIRHSQPAQLIIDGSLCQKLPLGAVVEIKKSERPIQLVSLAPEDFFKSLSARLKWN